MADLTKNLIIEYAVCTRFPGKLAKQIRLMQVAEGVYDFHWGSRNIRLIVTSRIAKEKRNAVWLMFGAVADRVGYGVSHYDGRMDEMSSAIERLLAGYETERIIAMPYTIEDFREEMKQRALKFLTPEEIAKAFPAEKIFGAFPTEERLRGLPPEERPRGLPAEEILGAFPAEEIRAYLKKLPKKSAPAKKRGAKAKKSA